MKLNFRERKRERERCIIERAMSRTSLALSNCFSTYKTLPLLSSTLYNLSLHTHQNYSSSLAISPLSCLLLSFSFSIPLYLRSITHPLLHSLSKTLLRVFFFWSNTSIASNSSDFPRKSTFFSGKSFRRKPKRFYAWRLACIDIFFGFCFGFG